jgi:peptide/nickel transport system permease protein
MWGYLSKRVVQMAITFLLFQAVTYFIIDAQPGDIADLLANNPDIPPGERQRLRQELGLDKPPLDRFITYVTNFYQGNLGRSFVQYPKPVAEIIIERLPRTLVLFLTASIVAGWTGFVTGKILAWKRGGWIEHSSTVVGVTLYTVFTPWFGLMMIWLFAIQLDLLPAGKFLDPIKWLGTDVSANGVFISLIFTALIAFVVTLAGFLLSNRAPRRYRTPIRILGFLVPLAGAILYWATNGLGVFAWDILSHTILPVLTVTLIAYGGYMLLTRTSMLETLKEDYILTARAKGLPAKMIRDKHAARTALLPVWTGLVFAIGFAVSGGIITEGIFSWPGLGQTLLNSALVADIPVALGALTVVGVMVLISHLVADVGYAFIDPRIRYH